MTDFHIVIEIVNNRNNLPLYSRSYFIIFRL
nr:MAG TPA: hypothetical protein [Caudoviricetes sp.]